MWWQQQGFLMKRYYVMRCLVIETTLYLWMKLCYLIKFHVIATIMWIQVYYAVEFHVIATSLLMWTKLYWIAEVHVIGTITRRRVGCDIKNIVNENETVYHVTNILSRSFIRLQHNCVLCLCVISNNEIAYYVSKWCSLLIPRLLVFICSTKHSLRPLVVSCKSKRWNASCKPVCRLINVHT